MMVCRSKGGRIRRTIYKGVEKEETEEKECI